VASVLPVVSTLSVAQVLPVVSTLSVAQVLPLVSTLSVASPVVRSHLMASSGAASARLPSSSP